MEGTAEVDKERVQRCVRFVLVEADRLSRVEHENALESASQSLAALRTVLRAIDQELGRGARVAESFCDELRHLVTKLRRLDAAEGPRPYDRLLDDVEDIEMHFRGHEPRPRPLERRRESVSPAFIVAAAAGAAAIAGIVVAARRK